MTVNPEILMSLIEYHGYLGHGKMSVAVRACACNERGSACNARAMRMDPVHVRGICGFLYLSL